MGYYVDASSSPLGGDRSKGGGGGAAGWDCLNLETMNHSVLVILWTAVAAAAAVALLRTNWPVTKFLSISVSCSNSTASLAPIDLWCLFLS